MPLSLNFFTGSQPVRRLSSLPVWTNLELLMEQLRHHDISHGDGTVIWGHFLIRSWEPFTQMKVTGMDEMMKCL